MQTDKRGKVVLWALPANKLFDHLKSSQQGLAAPEAKARLEKYGTNEIRAKERKGWREVLLSQFRNALVLVLVAAAIISFFIGEKIDSAVILVIVLINTSLGFAQEYKAERVLAELKKYVTITARVRRDGNASTITAKEIVPGDIVLLKVGDIVPADIRLLEADNLTIDESSLTGESAPVLKKATTASKKHSVPQYLHNVAFMGTSVTSGSAYGIAIATGKDTFFGKTATYLQPSVQSDFQKSIGKFSNFLLKIIVAMTLFTFAANAILGKDIFDSFFFAVALAIGITPEVLPIIVTIALSKGALKMSRKKVIIKRLSSVEDLGNIDTLCCDKTGTLTEGKFQLERYVDNDEKKADKVALYGLLCSSISDHKESMAGNPVDAALWQSKAALSLHSQLQNFERLKINEFDFVRRRMSVLARMANGSRGSLIIAKGAPEAILKACKSAIIEGKKQKLTKSLVDAISKRVSGYEKDGYNVIAVASRPVRKLKTSQADERDLELQGFLLFLDPAKKTAKSSIKTLQRLGVAVKVLSGDSAIITRRICNDVGLKIAENRVVTGQELEHLSKKEFYACATKYNVFARVTPEQKFRIVAALNDDGKIVGFLGDGVNDAPALKAADVGISVDSGTAVAKEAADIILLKKGLDVLADGIEEGRKTFGNITKYIVNTISANYGNMFTVAAASLFLKFIPMLPSQILLNNLITDVPLLTISADKVDKDMLKRPKRWNLKLISEFMIYFGLLSTLFDLAFILPLILMMNASPELLRTAWFLESALSEIIIIFSLRTRLPFFKSMPSKWLLYTSLIAGIGVIALTNTKLGWLLFGFVPLPASVLILIAGVLAGYIASAEVAKKFFFSRFDA